jgi:hypothetical protein
MEVTANGKPCRWKEKLLWWQKMGVSFNLSGYGSRIPMTLMVQLPGSRRWRRVYCRIYGNSGTCYVESGKKPDGSRAEVIIDRWK